MIFFSSNYIWKQQQQGLALSYITWNCESTFTVDTTLNRHEYINSGYYFK